MSSPLAPRPSVLLIGLVLAACNTGRSTIGELEDAESSSTQDGSTSTSGTPPDSTAASGDAGETTADPLDLDTSTGDAPVFSCPPESPCNTSRPCAFMGPDACGGIIDRLDDYGCPRPPCQTDDECPEGYFCFLPHDWALCGHAPCYDDPITGACVCDEDQGCSNDGLCVSLDDPGAPPQPNGSAACRQHASALTCEPGGLVNVLGKCRWYEGWRMPTGAVCAEREEIAQCVYVPFVSNQAPLTSCPGDPTLTPMALDDGEGQLTVLMVDPADQPVMIDRPGEWLPCDVAGTEAECECGCP